MRLRATRDQQGNDADVCRVLRELREIPAIFGAIAEGPDDELALQRELRDQYDDDLVRAALRLVDSRERGTEKFARAAEMWFDRVGLEQATSEAIARHKAARFAGGVDDFCCGIGGDTLALAQRCDVQAVDRQESLTLMTAWNAEVYGVADRVTPVVGNVLDRLSGDRLVHIDPDRRSGKGRSIRIEDYQPDLDSLLQLIDGRPGGAIKVSPASNFGGKFPDCEIELVSLNGECKEAIVWFGALAGEDDWRASVLPSGETISADPLSEQAAVGPIDAFVFDPDPAIVRSGLLDVVAVRLGLSRIDGAEEYLTGGVNISSPFVTPFAVVADLPNSDKQVRRYFREHPFGQVEIKCRHLRVDVEAYRRKLPLKGRDAITLIFARVDGRTRVLVCQRVDRGIL